RVTVLVFYCVYHLYYLFFFFSSRRRHTRSKRDWSSDVCSSDLSTPEGLHVLAVGAQELLHDLVAAVGGEAQVADAALGLLLQQRSEERRVGKEGGARRGRYR